jgi:hypothetical protein
MTMLEFAEAILKDLRLLRSDTETMVLNGSVANMERYRFLMGRLEGLNLLEEAIKERLKKHNDDF